MSGKYIDTVGRLQVEVSKDEEENNKEKVHGEQEGITGTEGTGRVLRRRKKICVRAKRCTWPDSKD